MPVFRVNLGLPISFRFSSFTFSGTGTLRKVAQVFKGRTAYHPITETYFLKIQSKSSSGYDDLFYTAFVKPIFFASGVHSFIY